MLNCEFTTVWLASLTDPISERTLYVKFLLLCKFWGISCEFEETQVYSGKLEKWEQLSQVIIDKKQYNFFIASFLSLACAIFVYIFGQTKLVELPLLSPGEIKWLNEYHAQVWEKVSELYFQFFTCLCFSMLGHLFCLCNWMLCILGFIQVSPLLNGEALDWLWRNTRPL